MLGADISQAGVGGSAGGSSRRRHVGSSMTSRGGTTGSGRTGMNKARRRRIIEENYTLKPHKLLSRHFFNVGLLVVIALIVSLYYYLLAQEEKVAGSFDVEGYGDGNKKRVTTLKESFPDGNRRKQSNSIPLDINKSSGSGGRGNMMLGVASAYSVKSVLNRGKPFIVYGTAWKKDMTSTYVAQAVQAGFRFIDTACQPKHYNEAGVGVGWTTAAKQLGLDRSDFFLQTKFTSYDGQDPNNVPYDHTKPLVDQVEESLQVSLKNLQTPYLDSLVLHSPMNTMEDTMTVWRTMESFVDDGTVKRIGISNCYDYQKFTLLYEQARVKPSVLQNRFYEQSNFDTELRRFCKENDVWYQSFWTLTANRHALATPEVQQWASSKGLTAQTLMFAFLLSLGYVTPLSGTTNVQHMAEDVAVMERVEGGEVFFENETELRRFAKLLGMPDL